MNEAILKIRVKKPKLVEKSLKPDLEKNVSIKSTKKFIIINIKREKISHLKGIINSMLTLVKMLDDLEEIK